MSQPPEGSAASGSVRARRSAVPGAFPSGFFDRPADVVARELLGARLISTLGGVRVECEVVETEAYTGPEDEASHAAERFGRTARNDPMFGPAGTAYVYLIYGMHWCLNVVTGPVGFGAAVLLRAARPADGIGAVRERRPGRPDRELMRGPGNLARALGVHGALNRHPLHREPLLLLPGTPIGDPEVRAGPRVGITRASELPLRYFVRDSPWVSRGP